jgi:hypothetical protein
MGSILSKAGRKKEILRGCLFGLPRSFPTLEAGSPNKHQASWYSFEG